MACVKVGNKVNRSFEVNNGVRQGDALTQTTVIFNLAIDKVLKTLQVDGNVFHKMKQVCVYADGTVLSQEMFRP